MNQTKNEATVLTVGTNTFGNIQLTDAHENCSLLSLVGVGNLKSKKGFGWSPLFLKCKHQLMSIRKANNSDNIQCDEKITNEENELQTIFANWLREAKEWGRETAKDRRSGRRTRGW